MPFWYSLPVPALDDSQPKSVRLVRWLVDDGAAVRRGTRVAVIEAPSGQYAVLANGNGLFREKHFLPGAEIDSSVSIAIISADGEDIPYGRPYSVAERLAESVTEYEIP